MKKQNYRGVCNVQCEDDGNMIFSWNGYNCYLYFQEEDINAEYTDKGSNIYEYREDEKINDKTPIPKREDVAFIDEDEKIYIDGVEINQVRRMRENLTYGSIGG